MADGLSTAVQIVNPVSEETLAVTVGAKILSASKVGVGIAAALKTESKLEKTPVTHPEIFDNIKNSKAKYNLETGEVWVKDLLHKSHYEVYKNKNSYEDGVRARAVWSDGRLKKDFNNDK